MCAVNQALGSSVGAIGMIEIVCTIEGQSFRHKFIVCSALKASMILGLDFAQSYQIGIDWDDNMEPYLRSGGKYLTTAMPLQALSPEAMVQVVQTQPQHTRIKNVSPKIKRGSVSCKPKPMIRLLSHTQVRLPPKTLSIVPVSIKEPYSVQKIRTMDVMGYDSFYVEYPDVSILPTTHTKMNKNKAGYLVLFVYNSGNDEVIVNKSSTLALGTKSAWKVKTKHQSSSKPDTQTEVTINHLTSQPNGLKSKNPSAREALENTAFVGKHNTYTKPKVKIKDVQLSCKLQKKFEQLNEKYSDIFSVGPSDIGITDLSEMSIDTRPDVIPYTVRPYKLALQHQDFLRKEIQALLDTGIIVQSISCFG